jgi:ABC-type phosphate transport system substrate-binding protein
MLRRGDVVAFGTPQFLRDLIKDRPTKQQHIHDTTAYPRQHTKRGEGSQSPSPFNNAVSKNFRKNFLTSLTSMYEYFEEIP